MGGARRLKPEHADGFLSQDCFKGLFEGLLIFSVEFSHLPDDEAFFDGGEDGFGWFYPAGDGHEDEIGAAAMIGG